MYMIEISLLCVLSNTFENIWNVCCYVFFFFYHTCKKRDWIQWISKTHPKAIWRELIQMSIGECVCLLYLCDVTVCVCVCVCYICVMGMCVLLYL